MGVVFTFGKFGMEKVRGQSVDIGKEEAPQISGLRGFFVPIIRGAESQSLTDTGSPPPVFESGPSYIS